MRTIRHHLLQIILWPCEDGTFKEIRNSKKRLKELGIYDDFKMTINITEGEHTTLHKKGQSFTEEHKKHLSEAHKGIKLPAFTEEHKKKIGDAQRGDKNHMYGKKASKETRDKMRFAHLGHDTTTETRNKISAANTGKKYFNNGVICVRSVTCPEGFVPGMLKRKI